MDRLHSSAVCRLRAGFTLVEIFVVVGILLLLLSLVIPLVHAARTHAYIAESTHNLRQLVQANFSHALDNGGRLAYAANERNTKRWCAAKVGDRWDRPRGYLSPYLG